MWQALPRQSALLLSIISLQGSSKPELSMVKAKKEKNPEAHRIKSQ